MSVTEDKVLALAGIFQSARLVQRLAHTNTVFQQPFAAGIHSILVTDADSTHEIFGMRSLSDIAPLQVGLEGVRDKLGGNTDADDFEVARYVIGMIQLAKKLNADIAMLDRLSTGIDRLAADFPPSREMLSATGLDDDLIQQIADLYRDTISTLSPRIIVNGEESILKNEMATAKIRAALMAGIRAAHLWWQLGGRRWQVLLQRKLLSETAARLLQPG